MLCMPCGSLDCTESARSLSLKAANTLDPVPVIRAGAMRPNRSRRCATSAYFLGDKRLHIVASKMIWPKRIAPLLKEICNFDDFRIACQFWRCKNIGACRLYIRRDDQEITVGQIDSVQAFANAFGKCIASKHKKRHVRAQR